MMNDENQAVSSSFEYELLDVGSDCIKTVVAAPNQVSALIDPSELKLKHRIGRGTFGDVWLATHHQKSSDFEEYHEVAVKMLHPVEADSNQKFLDKFRDVFLKLRQISGVCCLYGASVINKKICIVMKFYDGSVADKLALSKTRKLQLSDALRCGIQLGLTIAELHEIGLLVLNLKPSNFLLKEQDQFVLGDFGIPFFFLGIPPMNAEYIVRHGTPNYMAPEQWHPEERGPMSFETDSWGFGCSFLEMVTGMQPWYGMSIEEIRHSVVTNHKKPQLPTNLPAAVKDVILGCFEYDLRFRPLMRDIVFVFQSTLTAVSSGIWTGVQSEMVEEKSSSSNSRFFRKDHLQMGDSVRSRRHLNLRKPPSMEVENGTVVGLDTDTDRKGFVLIKIAGKHSVSRVHESTLARVSYGLAVGDWVRLKEPNANHSSVGVLHSVQRDGRIAVGFAGLSLLWSGTYQEVDPCTPYDVGQFVRLKREEGRVTGRISMVLPNGSLEVRFPGRLVLGDRKDSHVVDPDDVELVSFDTCRGPVEKYQHVEDFHWVVRPATIAVGLFIVVLAGRRVCGKVRSKRKKGNEEEHGGANPHWLPHPVANILFKEGN